MSLERSFGISDINDKEKFSVFQIFLKKATIYELTEHAKSENALNDEKLAVDDWLKSGLKTNVLF